MVNTRRKLEQVRLDELAQSFNVTPGIRNLVDMQESVSLRKPVFLMNRKSKGKKDYNKLWDSLGFMKKTEGSETNSATDQITE